MKKPDRLYEPHLAFREHSVRPGGEWLPRVSGWSVIQVESGTGYCLQAQSSTELEAEAVLLVGPHAQGSIRASQLEGLVLRLFSVMPERLTGLIAVGEQDFLRDAASRGELSLRVFEPHSPVAAKMKELYAGRKSGGLRLRLQLLQLFVEAFGDGLQPRPSNGGSADAKERLRVFLRDMPQAELLELNLGELAQMTRCTSRHFSRIFRELVGIPFRDKRAEVRLERARELLVTSRHKVVEVALESGFNSLSLFNLMFTRRFGTSPGRWRQNHRTSGASENHRNKGAQPIPYRRGYVHLPGFDRGRNR